MSRTLRAVVPGVLLLVRQGSLCAEPLPVRYPEGVTHGLVNVRTLEGDLVGVGELFQVVRGDRVSLRHVYRFKDKSIQDEGTVFSQRGTFRLLSDHLLQKGPKIGGLPGVVAPLLGMQPPDSHVWALGAEAPTVVKAEAPLFRGGLVLRVELASPRWP